MGFFTISTDNKKSIISFIGQVKNSTVYLLEEKKETVFAMKECTIQTVIEDVAEATCETKIYCANCIHCKLVSVPADTSGQYVLRVRCDAGKWKKKLGEEKLYKYCTVTRRSLDFCDCYDDMGESQDYMKKLRQSLPVKDEAYVSGFETF